MQPSDRIEGPYKTKISSRASKRKRSCLSTKSNKRAKPGHRSNNDKLTVIASISESDSEATIDEAAYCHQCSKMDHDDLLLICDKDCGRLFHTYCLGLPQVPDGMWYCPICTEKGKCVHITSQSTPEEGPQQAAEHGNSDGLDRAKGLRAGAMNGKDQPKIVPFIPRQFLREDSPAIDLSGYPLRKGIKANYTNKGPAIATYVNTVKSAVTKPAKKGESALKATIALNTSPQAQSPCSVKRVKIKHGGATGSAEIPRTIALKYDNCEIEAAYGLLALANGFSSHTSGMGLPESPANIENARVGADVAANILVAMANDTPFTRSGSGLSASSAEVANTGVADRTSIGEDLWTLYP